MTSFYSRRHFLLSTWLARSLPYSLLLYFNPWYCFIVLSRTIVLLVLDSFAPLPS
jgi:hypothetical protein